LGRCPHLQNLTTKLRKAKKKEENLDLTHILPIPKLTNGRRPYHFSSYTMSFNQQAKRRKSIQKCYKIKGGVEI
jgi:hypothetical protein